MTDRILRLRFDTATTRASAAWEQFYLDNDGFYHEQRKRAGHGLQIGTYELPRHRTLPVWMTADDLDRHALVVGATGTGKSLWLLERMTRLAFAVGRGCTVIDPHGDLYARLAAFARVTSLPDLTLLDFTQPETLPPWNPLAPIAGVDPGRQVDLLVGILTRLYADRDAKSWSYGVKAEEILRYALRACIESAQPNTLDTMRSFLLLPKLRETLLATCSVQVRHYFRERFAKGDAHFVSAVLNKLEPFLNSRIATLWLGNPVSAFDPLAVMDRGGTVLVNLAKGYTGPAGDLLGRLLLNALELGALRREAVAPEARRPYSIMVDEAHTYATADGALDVLLTAARKYRVSLVFATQSLALFPPKFARLALGNAGEQFFFRLPYDEAQRLAPGLFEPRGNVPRPQVRAYDKITDPYLTPAEEIVARGRELADLPVGACYWLKKGRPYKARRIALTLPDAVPTDRSIE